MDTLKDIWASLVAGVQERTTNPLTFSFAASWCLFNYRFFFILSGDGTTAERLQRISDLYPHTVDTYLGGALAFPLASALAYVFIYPTISGWAITFYRARQVAIANSIRDIEGARLLTEEQSIRLTRQHEAERAELLERESKVQEQLRQVRDALAKAESELSTVRTSTNQMVATHSLDTHNEEELAAVADVPTLSRYETRQEVSGERRQRQIALLLSETASSMTSAEIASKLKINHSVVKMALNDLKKLTVVEQDRLGQWRLTDTGHSIAAKVVERRL